MENTKLRCSNHVIRIPNPEDPGEFNLYKELKKAAVDEDMTLQDFILVVCEKGMKQYIAEHTPVMNNAMVNS